MTSNGWADALLVVTVLAPLATVVLALVVALPGDDQRWITTGCAVAAIGGFVLLVTGQHPRVSRLAPDDLALAATIATALLALGARTSSRVPALAAAATIAACGVTAGSPGRPSVVGPVLALAAATALLALVRDTSVTTISVIGALTVLAAWGVRSGGRGGAAAVVLAVGAAAVAAAFVPRRSVAVLAPVALLVGLRVGPVLAGTGTARWVAVVLGVAAVALTFIVRLRRSPVWALSAALVPWVLLAAVEPVPGTGSAARLLAAAAVLALLLGGPMASLAALPGAAVVVYAIADVRGWPRPVLGLLAVATLVGVLRSMPATTPRRIGLVDATALALGGWMLVRPTAWNWTHVSGLATYDDGTLAGLASALIVAVLATARAGALDLSPIAPWVVADDAPELTVRWKVALPVLAVTAAMGISAALLLRSARL